MSFCKQSTDSVLLKSSESLRGFIFPFPAPARAGWSFRAQLREAQPFALPEMVAKKFIWPPIWRSEHLSTPIAVGLFRPRIYLNSTTIEADASTLQAILYHELAHVHRRDGWAVLLQTFAQILHPFNPLVWLMNIRLSRYREQICDDFALQHASMASQRYGEMLLGFLEARSRSRFAASVVGFFETKEIVKSLREGRVVSVRQSPRLLITAAEPVDGFLAIQQHLVYPETARAAKIQGTVFLQILVLETGEVGEVKVLMSPMGHMGLEEAAIKAVKSVKWKPALAQGKPLKSWIGLPVKFSLDEC